MEYLINVIKGFIYAVTMITLLLRTQPVAVDNNQALVTSDFDQEASGSSIIAKESNYLDPGSITNTEVYKQGSGIATPTPQTPTPVPSPTTTPSPTPQTNQENYQFEAHPSGEEGFFVIKNAPVEAMSTEDELMDAVNNYRRNHNLNTLNRDDGLCQIAKRRAQEASQDFSHDKFQESVQNGDYNHVSFTSISENLWDGSFTGVHIVEFGWDRSPGHRANMQGNWSRGCPGINGTTAVFIFAN